MNRRISVVVLTHNRVREVTRTVERLLALPEKPPVIVADNGSEDETVAELERCFPGVIVVECGANLGAAGRNRAVASVTTEYVAFSDDDTSWEPGSLDQAVRVLDAAPRVGVLSAKVLVGNERRIDRTCLRMSASPLERDGLPGPALVGYMAGACVFRTALFRELGGYEARLFIGGEEELVALDALEAGRAIVYCDSVVTVHCPSPSRDASLRTRMLARNAALIAWLRLPIAEAFAATCKVIALLMRERSLARHAPPLLGDILWAIRRRRVVSSRVLRMRQQVREAERSATFRSSYPQASRSRAAVPSNERRQ